MIYILILIVLFVIELLYFKLADYLNIIDKPTKRSSHKRVTLRGGGVIFYIGVLFYFIVEGLQYPWFFLGLTLITMVSFVDDIHPLSFKLRLPVHFVAMALMFHQWGLYLDQWYFTMLAIVICIGILNAFNFMDGINGITGIYSFGVILLFWYIDLYMVQFVDIEIIYYMIVSIIVFIYFNFRKNAKCFAGDVGAISIAFFILFLLGLLIVKTNDFSYIILLVVYGIDSVLTIVHRLILKENIFYPHRKHAYQIMANELKIPHVMVSSFYALFQILIVCGYFIFKSHSYLYLSITILVLSLIYLIFKLKYYKLHENSDIRIR